MLNNHSQNRGSKGITTMTQYEYSDTFYNAICDEVYKHNYGGFPQYINNSCGKSVKQWGKG